MQEPNSDIRDYLDRLNTRFSFLLNLYNQIKILNTWYVPDKISAINEGSYFFRLVKISFYRTISIELCLFLNHKEQKSLFDFLEKCYDNSNIINPKKLNLISLKREKISVKEYQGIILSNLDELSKFEKVITKIKKLRDVSLAHSDAKYFNKPELIDPDFSDILLELPELISLVDNILKEHNSYLLGIGVDFIVYTERNVERVLRLIRAFSRVCDDSRAYNLPIVSYLNDNFDSQ